MREEKNRKNIRMKRLDQVVTEEIEDETETLCGIGSFKPKWLQPWATPNVYVALFSVIGILQGAYYNYMISILSTLEKRFKFNSKTSSSIVIIEEFTPLFLGILVGYIGGKTHRPRMVSFGMILSALCCLSSALPYFVYGEGEQQSIQGLSSNSSEVWLCTEDEQVDFCSEVGVIPPATGALFFFMFGNFLKGFGYLFTFVIGLSYMDDIAKKKNAPLYFSITSTLQMIGPILGFAMSSVFLQYYENPSVDPGFGPEDPRWIGGWWIGFVLQAILLLIFSIPVALFPRRLPGQRRKALKCNDNEKEESSSTIKALFDALKRLLTNPLYVFLALNAIASIYSIGGHHLMKLKYMEDQFRMTASDASLYSGIPSMVTLMVANVVGGYLIYKYKPSAKFLIAGFVLIEVIQTLSFFLLMIPHCEKVEMVNFGTEDNGLIVSGTCNMHCNCTIDDFSPVCASDGRTVYLSPCHAGCSQSVNGTFTNCFCMNSTTDFVTEGLCEDDDCWSQALIYLIALPLKNIAVNCLNVGRTMVVLRAVKPEDKSIALGAFETLLSILGYIPFPICYGFLVDSACLVWGETCGESGNCWFYDSQRFNHLLHGTSAFFSLLGGIAIVVTFFFSGRVTDIYKDDDGWNRAGSKNSFKGRL